jgi:uncharacterized membrane protein YphA (DoxX/SURF4 family)
MDGFGYACGGVLAALLVWAAVAKLGRPHSTAQGFAALELPAATALAWMVPAAELVVAVVLLAAPRLGGVAALVLLALFSAVIARALHAGVEAPCACFGTRSAEEVAPRDLVRNGLFALLAVAALVDGRPRWPSPAAAAVSLVVAGVGAVALRAAHPRSRPARGA